MSLYSDSIYTCMCRQSLIIFRTLSNATDTAVFKYPDTSLIHIHASNEALWNN